MIIELISVTLTLTISVFFFYPPNTSGRRRPSFVATRLKTVYSARVFEYYFKYKAKYVDDLIFELIRSLGLHRKMSRRMIRVSHGPWLAARSNAILWS